MTTPGKLLLIFVAFATAQVSTIAAAVDAPRPPNIVFIMVDDMGWADLECFGSKAVHTPFIDRLAANGMRFTQAYAGACVCAPSRCVLMTGLHGGHTSVRANIGCVPLADQDVTVAEVLKQAGYTCGGFGKWGLGDINSTGAPERQGFDLFFGYYNQLHAHDYFTTRLFRNSEPVMLHRNADGERGQYSHYEIFDQTLLFLDANWDRPFFCYAPWTPPHVAYELPQDEPAWKLYEDQPWPREARVAAAMVSMVDRHVGEVVQRIQDLGIADNTIIFFCSDNGGANRFEGTLDSCGPLRGNKTLVYEGGLRTPLVVWSPRIVCQGKVSDHPCYFADMLPTFAELAGATKYVPKDIDGISLVPTLLGWQATPRQQKKHEFMYWELNGIPYYPNSDGAQAVRMGDWKAVRTKAGAAWELYDLKNDVGETKDLAAEQPDVVAKIDAWVKQDRREPPPQIEPEENTSIYRKQRQKPAKSK